MHRLRRRQENMEPAYSLCADTIGMFSNTVSIMPAVRNLARQFRVQRFNTARMSFVSKTRFSYPCLATDSIAWPISRVVRI